MLRRQKHSKIEVVASKEEEEEGGGGGGEEEELCDKIVAAEFRPALHYEQKAPYLKLNLFLLSDEKVG